MDLVVLIKQVPDPEKNAGMKDDGTLNREESTNIVNPYDLNAVEEAGMLKEQYGGTVTVNINSEDNIEFDYGAWRNYNKTIL